MNMCCAPGCKNRTNDKKQSFFNFPNEPGRCNKWLRFCGLEHRYKTSMDVQRKKLKLCSDHFNESDYYSVYMGQRRKLNSTAVPSIHSIGTVVPQEVSQLASRSPSSAPMLSSPGTVSRFEKHKLIRTYARTAKMQQAGTAQDMQTVDISGPVSHEQQWRPIMSSTPKDMHMESTASPVPSTSAIDSTRDTQADNVYSSVSCKPLWNFTMSSTLTGAPFTMNSHSESEKFVIKREEDPLLFVEIKSEPQETEECEVSHETHPVADVAEEMKCEIKTEPEEYYEFPEHTDIKSEIETSSHHVDSINTISEAEELLQRVRTMATPTKLK